jgi:hypothetical protein
MPRRLTQVLAAFALVATLAGCAGSASYAGGPTPEEEHGIVDPGWDVTLWTVDDEDTTTRHGKTYVEPGRRKLRIRIEHPIESDDWAPYEFRNIIIDVAAKTLYAIDRQKGEFPPYDVDINEFDLE